MKLMTAVRPQEAAHIAEPPIAKFFFADTRMAWLWLIVRLYVGYQWLVAGLEKLTGHDYSLGPSFGQSTGALWVFTSHTGAALKGFIMGSLSQASGAHPAVEGWYASFLQHVILPNVAVLSYVVTFGEILVGLGLIFGVPTGIAAFFGVFMNLNFMLAGAVSINPVIGMLAVLLVLVWRIAGFYGVDSYLLPLLGTPWTGRLVHTATPIIKETEAPRTPVAAR